MGYCERINCGYYYEDAEDGLPRCHYDDLWPAPCEYDDIEVEQYDY